MYYFEKIEKKKPKFDSSNYVMWMKKKTEEKKYDTIHYTYMLIYDFAFD